MSGRSATVASLAIAVVIIVLAAIIIIPAEVVFYANTGSWYGRERAVQAAPTEGNDFRLYRAPFSLRKTAGRTRILGAGGSTTYGFGVEANQAWPQRLRRRLADRFPGRFEVVDVSYLGGHLESFISDYARASRRYIPRDRWIDGERPGPRDLADWGWRDLDPDIVIVVPIVNDTAPDYLFMRRHDRWQERAARAIERTQLLADLAIGHYTKAALRKLAAGPSDFHAARAMRQIENSYRNNLERFVALWGPERRIFVLGLPWLFNLDDPPASLDLAVEFWETTDRAELADELSYFPKLETLEVSVRRSLITPPRENLLTAEVGQSIKSLPFRRRLKLYVDPLHATAEGHDSFAAEILDLIARQRP